MNKPHTDISIPQLEPTSSPSPSFSTASSSSSQPHLPPRLLGSSSSSIPSKRKIGNHNLRNSAPDFISFTDLEVLLETMKGALIRPSKDQCERMKNKGKEWIGACRNAFETGSSKAEAGEATREHGIPHDSLKDLFWWATSRLSTETKSQKSSKFITTSNPEGLAYRDALDAGHIGGEAREAMRDAMHGFPHDSLRDLFTWASRASPQRPRHIIQRQLASMFTVVDKSRLAYTATQSSASSTFINKCLGIEDQPKHPDLIIKGNDNLELGFGEVSGIGALDGNKDAGDLCRLAIWTKKALDHAFQRKLKSSYSSDEL
ncbi:MAG: hypothetical protein J3Q66DRAFT_397087 [Benniella sp.]|nr:MAG: hypothetical protein J3Q66DRAFT_397087 [Benniella sp.]